MGSDASKYLEVPTSVPQDVCALYVRSMVFYGVNIESDLRTKIVNIFNEIFNDNATIKLYNQSLVKFRLNKSAFYQGANTKKSTQGRLFFCRIHKLFCSHGWTLINSPTLTYEHSLGTWIFFRDISPFMMNIGNIDNDFCAIGLSGYDAFAFINIPEFLMQEVVKVVKKVWVKGVHEPKPIEEVPGCWSVELSGCPWSTSGEKSVMARNIILQVIQLMSKFNWRLVNSTAMKPDASDTLFFRKFNEAFISGDSNVDTMPNYYFMMALMPPGWIAVLGENNTGLRNTLAEICGRREAKGIKDTSEKANYPAISFVSKVWSRYYEKEVKTRLSLCLIFEDLSQIGWMPLESVDCTRKLKDLSSIVFVKIPPSPLKFFCLMPLRYSSSRLYMINSPPEVNQVVVKAFSSAYPYKNEKINVVENVEHGGPCSLIKFKGTPFDGVFTLETLMLTQALANVISELKQLGWYLVLSADTSTQTKTERHGDNEKTKKWSIYGLWFTKLNVG